MSDHKRTQFKSIIMNSDDPDLVKKLGSNETARLFWEQFLAHYPELASYQERPYWVEAFGDSPELADELAGLVRSGVKTATCSSLWEWQAEGLSPPEVGAITIVLDGLGVPACIIETLAVDVVPFNQVDPDFAAAEGEGDRSLQYWREAHWRFFTRTLAKIGRQPSPDMPLVCEKFRLIYNPARVNDGKPG